MELLACIVGHPFEYHDDITILIVTIEINDELLREDSGLFCQLAVVSKKEEETETRVGERGREKTG